MKISLRYLLGFLTLMILAAHQPACAQNYHTRSNRALKAYLQGKQDYEYFNFARAEQNLKEAISVDESFIEAYILLAELLYDRKRFVEAADNYRIAVGLDSSFYPFAFYYLGYSEFHSGQYQSALESYRLFLATNPKSQKLINESEKGIANSIFAIEMMKNPVPFNPVNLGEAVNTRMNEYSPSITADGSTLIFTRELEEGGNEIFMGRRQEDFYMNFRDSSGNWGRAINVGKPLNTPGNEGAHTLGSGGQYMYFTACDRPDGLGRCDIYYSSFDGVRWSDPVNIGPPINTIYWETQPSVSADGKTLFFVSSRPGGFGASDIWISEKQSDGKWGEPVNAGDKINTAGDETTPFIHFDGKTLYFASNGRPNLGGFDLYFSRLGDDDAWSDPVNLGYPVNTHMDEMGLVIESNSYIAYYASTRNEGNQKDLYWFELHESARPAKVSYLKGRVFDYETRRSLHAKYDLINLTTGEPVTSSSVNRDGQFLVCLPSGNNYGLNVSADGFLFYSENFPFEEGYTEFKPLVKDIFLHKIGVGEKLVLYNVLFEFNKSDFLTESLPELEKVLQILISNKGLKVEVGGHTDDSGTDEYNLQLSESRAKTVVNYLVNNGIERSRLTFKGYGESIPVQDNGTADGRRLNRRTEVKVLETGSK